MTKDTSILNEFAEFIIRETCQGCTMCNPGLNAKGVVCIHQGEAIWYRSEVELAEKYIKEYEANNNCGGY